MKNGDPVNKDEPEDDCKIELSAIRQSLNLESFKYPVYNPAAIYHSQPI